MKTNKINITYATAALLLTVLLWCYINYSEPTSLTYPINALVEPIGQSVVADEK